MTRRGPLRIDALHVINLDRRPERMRRFLSRVRLEQDWDVPVVRHAAVDTSLWSTQARHEKGTTFATYVAASELPVIERGFRTEAAQLSRGAVGCALSHMALWSYLAAHTDLEYLAVFEDDAAWALETHMPLPEVLELLEDRIPNDWDILSLGADHLEVACKHDWYSELRRYWATHAYIVHASAVGRLLRHMLPMRHQLDAAISEKTVTDGIRVVSPNRPLWLQMAPETDVQVPLHLPDGTVRNIDGTYTGPDGVRRAGDGTVLDKP